MKRREITGKGAKKMGHVWVHVTKEQTRTYMYVFRFPGFVISRTETTYPAKGFPGITITVDRRPKEAHLEMHKRGS